MDCTSNIPHTFMAWCLIKLYFIKHRMENIRHLKNNILTIDLVEDLNDH